MKKLLTVLVLLSFYGTAVFAAKPKVVAGGKEIHKSRRRKSKSNRRRKPPKTILLSTPTPVKAVSTLETPAVTPLPEAAEEIGMLSGNVVVPINTSSNAVIKIGLSAHGIALIDFPLNDPIYAIHPSDENLVTIGCRRREATNEANKPGRCLDNPNDGIILRPGTAFNEWADGVDASTIVTVQRVSGLVVPIIIIPVKRITQNANYIAIRYDVAKVIEARQAAGLSFNLNNQTPFDARQPLSDPLADNFKEKVTAAAEPVVAPELLAELRRVGMTKPILRFTKPVHGIALALASRSARLTENSIEVIAVKNTSNTPIRLTPEQPNLVAETTGEKNKGSVLSKDIDVLEIASNAAADDILQPGEVYYFAFSYKTPILGAKQTLRATFAHRAASDEPATLLLGDSNK